MLHQFKNKNFNPTFQLNFGNLHRVISNLVIFFPSEDYQSVIGLKLFLKLVESLTNHCCLIVYHASTVTFSK